MRTSVREERWGSGVWGHGGKLTLYFKGHQGTSLVGQWLRPCMSSARGTGLIPGQGTKSLHAVPCGQKNKNKGHQEESTPWADRGRCGLLAQQGWRSSGYQEVSMIYLGAGQGSA